MAVAELDLEELTSEVDPEKLAQAFALIEGTNTEPKAAEPPKEESQESTEAQGQQQAQQQDQQDEGDPAGVATKDGKHVIPYSVLKSERDRAARAEQIAKEMAERIAALEERVSAGNQGANTGESARTNPEQPAVGDLSQEDLENLKEDFPTVYKAVMASMAAARALETKLQPMEESMNASQAERARSAQETVQEAIDAVPKLAHIQATDAEAFEMAKQFDAVLRDQPAWADRPLSERFAKVAEMLESAVGPIKLPGGNNQASQSTGDMKAAARAKADAAAKAARSNVPTSLSEFPAGQHAAQDEREEAENLSSLQLAEKFSRMTPDQMDAYFRTL